METRVGLSQRGKNKLWISLLVFGLVVFFVFFFWGLFSLLTHSDFQAVPVQISSLGFGYACSVIGEK